MKIDDYGLAFQSMYLGDECYRTIEDCTSYIISKKKDNTPEYRLLIKVIWNGKSVGWLKLKFVQGMSYLHVSDSRFKEKVHDELFYEKFEAALPKMENYGNVRVGVLTQR